MGNSFCCRGCETVFELIHQERFERYYELRTGPVAPPAELRSDSFAWVDRIVGGDPAATGQTHRRMSVDVQGIHCAACVWLLQELGNRMPGGVDITINPSLGRAEIVWDPRVSRVKEYFRRAERFGYRFGPPGEGDTRRSKELLVRLGISAAAAMNVMVISAAYYFGLTRDDGVLYHLFGKISLFFTALAVAAGGSLFIRSAVAGLRRGLVHLDLPIALGVILAFLGSVWAYFTSGPDSAYFDTVTLFILLMLTGRWLQERVLERNRRALLSHSGTEGLFTRRLAGDTVESVRAADVEKGDEIWVVPGDLVPVEGILLSTDAELSLDWITGESEVRTAAGGDSIPAGAFNAGRRTLRIEAGEPFGESRLNTLLGGRSAPVRSEIAGQRWWRKVSTLYVAAVLLLAAAGFAAWAGRDLAKAIEVTVAILVVTCPCALGLAVPLAFEMIHTAARRKGIFIRSGNFLDKALSVKRILFDKTGTLTAGALKLTPDAGAVLGALSPDDRAVLYNMAVRSNHPASRALAAAVKEGFLAAGTHPSLLPGAESTEEHVGEGLEWKRSERTYRLGSGTFCGVFPGGENESALATRGLFFSVNGEVRASFMYEEVIKPDTRFEVAALEREGYEVYLLSGDTRAKVLAVAERLGIPAGRCWGALMPEEKAARVRELDHDSALMVGDGLNDAPSFDAAWCAATPAVDRAALPARADFYFLGEGISAVGTALHAARLARRVIRHNLIFAGAYNVFALALCYAGLVTPVAAAILMPVSSITVVAHTVWRLSGSRLSWKC